MAKRKVNSGQAEAQPIAWKFKGMQPGHSVPGVPRRDISLQEAQRKDLVAVLAQYPQVYEPVYAQEGTLADMEE